MEGRRSAVPSSCLQPFPQGSRLLSSFMSACSGAGKVAGSDGGSDATASDGASASSDAGAEAPTLPDAAGLRWCHPRRNRRGRREYRRDGRPMRLPKAPVATVTGAARPRLAPTPYSPVSSTALRGVASLPVSSYPTAHPARSTVMTATTTVRPVSPALGKRVRAPVTAPRRSRTPPGPPPGRASAQAPSVPLSKT